MNLRTIEITEAARRQTYCVRTALPPRWVDQVLRGQRRTQSPSDRRRPVSATCWPGLRRYNPPSL